MIALLWLACGSPPESPPPAPAPVALPETFGLGRAPTADEVAAWDIDVPPSWDGLPAGRGTVDEGRVLYQQQCLSCHGQDAKGGPGWLGPMLVATEPLEGFADDYKLPRVIGTWWPHASTLFDYVRRAMPQTAPGSLTPDQTYALVAFLLAENHVVDAAFVADQDSIKTVEMPTKVRFVTDDRETTSTFR